MPVEQDSRPNRFLQTGRLLLVMSAASAICCLGVNALATRGTPVSKAHPSAIALGFALAILIVISGIGLLSLAIGFSSSRSHSAEMQPINRPKGLLSTLIFMAVLTLTWYLLLEFSNPPRASGILLALFTMALIALLLWGYWRGANWARYLLLLRSIWSLILIVFPNLNQPQWQTGLRWVGAVLAIFLLVWLNTRPVKSFFRRGVQPLL